MILQQAQHEPVSPQTVKRGKPSLSGYKSARELLLLCTTASISPARKARLSQIIAGTVDWEYLLELAEFHGVTPLLALNLATNGLSSQVPKHHLSHLNQIYNSTLYRNVVLSAELEHVLSVFNRRGIAVIPLKGPVLAELLYGNPGLRTMVDMDILVKPEDITQASSLLAEVGYRQLPPKPKRSHPFHGEPYYKQARFPLFIELHWDLDDSELVSVPRQEIWRRARPQELQGGSILMLSAEDTLLFSAIQLSKESMRFLKVLGDIAELLKRYEAALDWDYIIRAAPSWQIQIPLYYSLRRARNLLGAPVPVFLDRILKPSAVRRGMIDLLMGQETFVSPIRWSKLRDETSVLVRSLMMKHTRQMLTVLSKRGDHGERPSWPGTVAWLAIVLGAALWRNLLKVITRRLVLG